MKSDTFVLQLLSHYTDAAVEARSCQEQEKIHEILSNLSNEMMK